MKFYKNGFFDEAVHGVRRFSVIEPGWVRPVKNVTLQPGESIAAEVDGELRQVTNDTAEAMELENVPDMSVVPPTVEVPNPDCKIPADAVEVSEEGYVALFADQSNGASIQADENGRPIAVFPPAPTLGELVAEAVRKIDADVDAIYGAVIGNRQAEYDVAEQDANAYKAAGYAGNVPSSVKSWADAKGWTAKKSADDILATSGAWRAAQADIRANRLTMKENARKATDAAGVATALEAWGVYVAQMRAALGA